MELHVDIQTASEEPVPEPADIRRWIAAALEGRREEAEVSVRLVDEPEMAELNRRYRGKPGATNVLSFPAQLPAGIEHPLLGDIVICPAVVNREANEQHKSAEQHWMHMLVHGSLHLLGYDHIEDDDALLMESLERQILLSRGFSDPYRDDALVDTNEMGKTGEIGA
jgi:probable rRNA maturation factor